MKETLLELQTTLYNTMVEAIKDLDDVDPETMGIEQAAAHTIYAIAMGAISSQKIESVFSAFESAMEKVDQFVNPQEPHPAIMGAQLYLVTASETIGAAALLNNDPVWHNVNRETAQKVVNTVFTNSIVDAMVGFSAMPEYFGA